MIGWIPYTFVRTVLVFMGGIVLGMYFPDILAERFLFLLIAVLAVSYFLVVFVKRRYSGAPNPGSIALCLVFVLGYTHVLLRTESRNPDHLINHDAPISHYKVIITRFDEERTRSWRTEGSIREVKSNGSWVERDARVVLYFSKEDYTEPFQYGDVLVVKGSPQVPEAPANPGEFDHRAYLALKNIYHQHFLRSGEAMKIAYEPQSRLLALAFKGRKWAEAVLKRFVRSPDEQAIASALVLGVTDSLDHELISAYSATGAMHILAVSGLHVSVLYLILLRVLRPLNQLPGGRWGVAFLSLVVLWMYAMVTGLSPSVLRAVTMFSFLAVARPWARRANVYNTLAVSAFFMLMFDPFLIRSVGFQLSYCAVLGIVYLYPRIISLWEPQHSLTTAIWKVSAVSMAAQVATFPLGLLYFHQFPNLFLLANLLVVPLSSVVLTLGLGVIAAGFVPAIATVLGYCLEIVLSFMNGTVILLGSLPFSLTDNVFITPAQCCLIMLFMVMFLALLRYRKFGLVVACFATATGFASLQWWRFATEVDIRKLTVYRIPGHTGIDLVDRGQAIFVADEALTHDERKMNYHVTPHRLMAGIGRVTERKPSGRIISGCRVLVWNGMTILVVTGSDVFLPQELTVDWIIVGNNAVDVGALSGVSCRGIILDSSNTFFFASRFLEEAKLIKLEVHSVLHQGAFMTKL